MSELKAINALGIRKDDGAYYDRSQVDKYIDELDERHTGEITALEVSYRLQLDGLRYDKDAEIRRLKRALWLARAISAINAVGEIHNAIVYMRELKPKMSLSNTEAQEYVWKNVARKCRAKAKEYK